MFRDHRIGRPEERLGGREVGTLADITQDRERITMPAGEPKTFDRRALEMRQELLGMAPLNIPSIMDYALMAENGSLLNTPPRTLRTPTRSSPSSTPAQML